MQSWAHNSHPSIWWPRSIVLDFGFREQVLLCTTNSSSLATMPQIACLATGPKAVTLTLSQFSYTHSTKPIKWSWRCGGVTLFLPLLCHRFHLTNTNAPATDWIMPSLTANKTLSASPLWLVTVSCPLPLAMYMLIVTYVYPRLSPVTVSAYHIYIAPQDQEHKCDPCVLDNQSRYEKWRPQYAYQPSSVYICTLT